MAGLQTSIQLQDRMSGILNNITQSMSIMLTTFEQTQAATDAGLNAASMDAAKQGIAEASAEMARYREEVERVAAAPPPAPPEPAWNSTAASGVFMNSGADRFQAEYQAADQMARQLYESQKAISDQARNMRVTPLGMLNDMANMENRIQALSLRVQQLNNVPVKLRTDQTNNELESLRGKLGQVVTIQETLNQAMGRMDISEANTAYQKLDSAMRQVERSIRDNTSEQGRFNDSVNQCNSYAAQVSEGFKGWQKGIIVANQAIGLIKGTLGSLGIMNTSGAFNRIDTMNRFQKTITVLTGDSNAAKAALGQLKDVTLGTAYGLDVASKSAQGFLTRGMSLGAATNQVRVWADAVSFYGEGTNEQLQSVVDAIGKMYSKGKVEADQLDRLFDAGIGAAEIYAQAVNKSVGAVKEDLSKGSISAANFISVVSEALDSGISAGAAKEAGNTWATTFANMRAAITRGWVSIITEIDSALASHGLPSTMEMVIGFGKKVEETLKSIASSMDFVIYMAMGIYDAMSSVGGSIVDNWSIISPIVYGVITILALYNGYLIVSNTIQAISNGLAAISAARSAIKAGATLAEAAATTTATGAQVGLNAALLSCPIVWIILLIIALIAIIFVVCNAIAQMTGVASSGFGVIMGAAAMAGAFLYNIFIGIINAIIQFLWVGFVEPFIGIIEWVLNAANGGFNSFGDAVANLIGQIISWFLSLGKVVTKIIDAIFGTDWTSGLSSLQDSVLSWGKNEDAITISRDAPMIDSRISYNNAFDVGSAWGDGIADKVSNFSLLDLFGGSNIPNVDETGIDPWMSAALNDTAGNTGKTAGNTARMADTMDALDEEIKYMRDAAEQEVINRFTLAELKIDMTNNNTLKTETDFDRMNGMLNDLTDEILSTAAEGGHL